MNDRRTDGRGSRSIDRRAFLAVTGAVAIGGCAAPRSGGPTAIEAPDAAPVDERIALSVAGVEAPTVEIEASTADGSGRQWSATAAFEPADGRVDVIGAAPVDGTYEGVDPMGLFWSMESDRTVWYDDHQETQRVTVTARERTAGADTDAADGGEPLAETTIERHLLAPGSRETAVEVPIAGTVVESPDPRGNGARSAPGIVLFHGSRGRRTLARARTLAGRGFTVLALQYFGPRWSRLPDALAEVPLEYVDEAIAWFRERESVADAPIGLGGVSRGGELAMTAATRTDDVGAVVNWVGAGLHVAAYDPSADDPDTSAWSADGEPTPHLSEGDVAHAVERTGEPAADRAAWFEPADEATLEAASIPLEPIDAPILLISAGADEIWPSRLLLSRTESRLDDLGYEHAYDHLSYDDAGHGIGVPFLPTAANRAGEFGGTPEATAAASADSWPTVVEYFRRGALR